MREHDKTREFMRRFAANLEDKGIHVVAYVLTEDEWISEFGKRFYKNYNSFKDCKSNYLKKYRRLPVMQTSKI